MRSRELRGRCAVAIAALFCSVMPLRSQSLGQVLKGALSDYARTKISEVEAKSGMALNPSGVPIVLENALRSAEYEGWTKVGELQQGYVIEGEGSTTAVAREFLSVLSIQRSGGEVLRVLAFCPGCASFQLSDGDDAMAGIGSLDIPRSSSGKITVPINRATCRPEATCVWYAQVLQKK